MSQLAPVATMFSPAASSVPVGGSLGQQWAEKFQLALEAADLNAALEAYADAPSWEDRWFCLEQASKATVNAALLDSWCEGWPDHVLPVLTRGSMLARSGDLAATIDLDRASEIDRESPIPWGLRVVLARTAGLAKSESATALAAMMPHAALYEPHIEYLLALGEGDHASSSDMIEFADNVCDAVPPGSPLRAAMPLAALQSMMVDIPDDHITYLRDKGVFDKVLMAAGQSVFHPEFEGQPVVPSLKAMNAFAIALSILAQDDLALLLVNRLGNSFTDWPLSLLGAPTLETWGDLRQRLIEKAPSIAEANGRA